VAPLHAQAKTLKISRTSETRSTCPYCSVSCGVIIHTLGDKAKNAIPQVVHVEGDPDHPINRGTLCPKGASLQQDILNDRRLLKPQVRHPGSDRWDDIGWDQALDEISRRVKQTPGLTRPDGLQFGAHIRTRRDDERLDRHQEHRHDVDHGRQSRRKPPVRLQVAD
jgi:anaerobic selenocysteine-containing dehydrogenase